MKQIPLIAILVPVSLILGCSGRSSHAVEFLERCLRLAKEGQSVTGLCVSAEVEVKLLRIAGEHYESPEITLIDKEGDSWDFKIRFSDESVFWITVHYSRASESFQVLEVFQLPKDEELGEGKG